MNILFESSAKNLKQSQQIEDEVCSRSMMDGVRNCVLTDILPYDVSLPSKGPIEKRLEEYYFLLEVGRRTFKAVLEEKYAAFDPLVGENACQIRALMNARIFSEVKGDYVALLESFENCQRGVRGILNTNSEELRMASSLKVFLENKNLEIAISNAEVFLIRSYLLTDIKSQKLPDPKKPYVKNEYTDIKKMKKLAPTGRMFAEKLVKVSRIAIAYSSTKFIQEIASNLSLPNEVIENISNKYVVLHRKLPTLPCYWYTFILLLQAIKKKLPIVMVARQLIKDNNFAVQNEAILCFHCVDAVYTKISINDLDSKSPAIFLNVNSCRNQDEFPSLELWKEELVSHSPIDLLLAYAANHRQYPDESDCYLVDDNRDQRYRYYKQKADSWGCTIDNPFLFYLSHAFCDKIENIPEHLDLPINFQTDANFEELMLLQVKESNCKEQVFA